MPPFNVGDHIRYIATQNRALPADKGNETVPILVHGMEGVILVSTGKRLLRPRVRLRLNPGTAGFNSRMDSSSISHRRTAPTLS